MTLNSSWIRKKKLLDLLVEIGIDIGNLKGGESNCAREIVCVLYILFSYSQEKCTLGEFKGPKSWGVGRHVEHSTSEGSTLNRPSKLPLPKDVNPVQQRTGDLCTSDSRHDGGVRS